MEVGAVSHSGNAFNATLSLGLEIIFKVLGMINQCSTTMLPTPVPHMFSLLTQKLRWVSFKRMVGTSQQ